MTSPSGSAELDEEILAWAEARCRLLYEGKALAHRSCGIALAETFGRVSHSYQALRRGGITGTGTCGAIQGGLLVLGEVCGDPDPTAPTTPELRQAADRYQTLVREHLGPSQSTICNDLTAPFETFKSDARHHMCTHLAAQMARRVAQVICELGGTVERRPRPDQ